MVTFSLCPHLIFPLYVHILVSLCALISFSYKDRVLIRWVDGQWLLMNIRFSGERWLKSKNSIMVIAVSVINKKRIVYFKQVNFVVINSISKKLLKSWSGYINIKVIFRTKHINMEKDDNIIMIKGPISDNTTLQNITILNISLPTKSFKCFKQKLIKLQCKWISK